MIGKEISKCGHLLEREGRHSIFFGSEAVVAVLTIYAEMSDSLNNGPLRRSRKKDNHGKRVNSHDYRTHSSSYFTPLFSIEEETYVSEIVLATAQEEEPNNKQVQIVVLEVISNDVVKNPFEKVIDTKCMEMMILFITFLVYLLRFMWYREPIPLMPFCMVFMTICSNRAYRMWTKFQEFLKDFHLFLRFTLKLAKIKSIEAAKFFFLSLVQGRQIPAVFMFLDAIRVFMLPSMCGSRAVKFTLSCICAPACGTCCLASMMSLAPSSGRVCRKLVHASAVRWAPRAGSRGRVCCALHKSRVSRSVFPVCVLI